MMYSYPQGSRTFQTQSYIFPALSSLELAASKTFVMQLQVLLGHKIRSRFPIAVSATWDLASVREENHLN